MKKYLWIPILVLVITVCLSKAIPKIGFNSYKEILSALMTISSIVFAIIGAWVAVIYPKAIVRNFDGKSGNTLAESEQDASNLHNLIEIALISAIVLMSILLILYIVPILKFYVIKNQIIYFKYIGFFVITTLTAWEVVALFSIILENYSFLNKLRTKNAREALDQVK